MIVDCIPFFREIDLVEIRLNVLADVVDRFLIVELDRTHAGEPKDFLFPEHLLGQFPIDYFPLKAPNLIGWDLENWHRRELHFDYYADDVVIVSDLDELPNPEHIKHHKFGRYVQDMYYYYLNASANQTWPSGTVVMPGIYATMHDLQQIRTDGHRRAGDTWIDLPLVKNGGWHFSSVGTKEDFQIKLKSFAHTEMNNEDILSKYDNLRSPHGEELTIVPIDNRYPTYIQQNQTRYRHLIYE